MKSVTNYSQGPLKQEILMKRVYCTQDGKSVTKKFYVERTPLENVVVFPYSMIDNLREQEGEFIGDAPEGQYSLGKVPVKVEKIFGVKKNLYGFAKIVEV